MSTIRIQTTQNVVLEYEAASVGDRMLAQLIDGIVMVLWAVGAGFLIDKVGSFTSQSVLQYLLIAGPLLVYHPVCEIFFNGQSLGKQVRKIKVTRLDGTRPGPGDYLLRWLIGLVEIGMTLGALALVAALFNGRGQRLGDLAAGTAVVSLQPRGPSVQTLTANVQVPAGYQPVFPQARHLSDHDAALIRRLFQQAAKQGDYLLLNELAMKVKSVTDIRTELHDEPFIRTILRDHAYFAAQESPHG